MISYVVMSPLDFMTKKKKAKKWNINDLTIQVLDYQNKIIKSKDERASLSLRTEQHLFPALSLKIKQANLVTTGEEKTDEHHSY